MALILPHNRVPAKHPQNHQNQKHKLQHFHDKSLTAYSSCPGDGKAKGERERQRQRDRDRDKDEMSPWTKIQVPSS